MPKRIGNLIRKARRLYEKKKEQIFFDHVHDS